MSTAPTTSSTLSRPVAGRIALVTGVGRPNGIGRAIVHALLAAGATKVYATARKASELTELVASSAGRVVPVVLDVTDRAAIAALPAQAKDVNLLINNAGLFAADAALVGGDGAAMFAVNYHAPMHLVRAFAPQLANGAIVNINSVAGLVNFPICAVYSDTKAALNSLTVAQRRELKPQSTLVMSVYPGPIETDMAKDIPFPTVPPSMVADALVAGLAAGAEEVYPDPMAEQVAAALKADPKAFERHLAGG